MPTAEEEPSQGPDFLPGHSDLDQFSQSCLRTIGKAIQASNQLPSREKKNFDFYSTFKGFRNVLDAESNAILAQMEKLMRWNGIRGKPNHAVSDMMDLLTECNDQLLERINTHLDEADGLKKSHDPVLLHIAPKAVVRLSGPWNARGGSVGASQGDGGVTRLVTAKNISRPQVQFKECIDNSTAPFMPKLKEKPNSKKPLSILVEHALDGSEHFSHPYHYELDLLKPTAEQMERLADVPKAIDKDATLWTLVNTPKALNAMIGTLKQQKEIAVDLEHHWYRSFLGFTCLIQISTWEHDFVVDPFPIWRDLTILNEVFTDPKIVKVFHGADHDVEWLQRDFSVYVVNMFDTHIAAKKLGYPPGTRSYANILNQFCQIRADKQFQLADWRIRPLPEEMLSYARTDTRYLIYIYRMMKNELLDKGNDQQNLLRATLQDGASLGQKRFRKPFINEQSHLDFLLKSRSLFNSRQIHALASIFQWRNKTARAEDESEAYILPNHMLLKICEELPREMQGILACCSPIPPLVKQNLQQLHMMVLQAREQPLTHIHVAEEQPLRTKVLHDMTEVVSDPMKTPLDLSRIHELDSRVLMDSDGTFFDSTASAAKTKAMPAVRLFARVPCPPKAGDHIQPFLSPYQRFVMLKPYLKFMNSQEEGDSKQTSKASDKDRIESIKEHFAALTALTEDDVESEKTNGKADDEAVKEEDEEQANDEEYYEEVEVKNLRQGIKGGSMKKEINHQRSNAKKYGKKKLMDKKKTSSNKVHQEQQQPETPAQGTKRKGPKEEERPPPEKTPDIDFSQFHSKKKRANNQMNEWKDFKDATKKGGKKKNRSMAGNKSMSYTK
eukprot:snap_masked-scaffold1570_size35393-processed-gene-0.9 protein:Tk03605 transcript:snap_masked-scaffold1570_size35393-processed-gene-0.9-mRNA-1 annotation:"exosome component 10"